MKKANIAVCVFFLLALAALSIYDIASPARLRSETENRSLAQMPEFSIDNVFNGSFTKGYEEYVVDQFTWRDGWIRIKSASERALGKTVSNGVYFADDGYFIEHKSDADVDRELLERNIAALGTFYTNMSDICDGRVGVAIAPTASVILADKLPRFNDEFDWNASLDSIASLAGDGCIDLRDNLLAHKDEYIYYKTDHHWTTDGAYYAYEDIIRHFGFEPLEKDAFERVVVSDEFYGTTIAKLNIKSDHDSICKYEKLDANDIKVNINLGAKITDTLYDEEKLIGRDKYAYFLGGNDALVEIDTDAASGRVLMLAKDSYANCLIPFLACHFEKIYVVDLRYFNIGVAEYAKKQGDVTDALVLYNISGFADDRYAFKLSR